MKKMGLIVATAVMLVGVGCTTPTSRSPADERRAASIVFKLPEVIALMRSYERRPDELMIDYEGVSEIEASAGATRRQVRTVGIYLLSPNGENWYPWAFFVVDERTGDVFVREPDWNRKEIDAFVYLPFAEWRRSRHMPNSGCSAAP